MNYNYRTSDPIQDDTYTGVRHSVLYSAQLGNDRFVITVSHQRITDLTPEEWEDANEWFCSECDAFADVDVEWTPSPSVLEGAFAHNGITYHNNEGKYYADFADDGGNVKLDASLPFAEMVKVAEAARFSAAQGCAACVLESKYGGDDLYSWQWEGISDETIAEFSAQDIIESVQGNLRNVWDYNLPDWVENAYQGIGYEQFKADSDYESALRAFLAKWQACKAEFEPLYGLAL